jgi:hypothetical protein
VKSQPAPAHQCASAYTYFVKKRFHEMKSQQGELPRLIDRIPVIAGEWKNMSEADRGKVAREWEESLASAAVRVEQGDS